MQNLGIPPDYRRENLTNGVATTTDRTVAAPKTPYGRFYARTVTTTPHAARTVIVTTTFRAGVVPAGTQKKSAKPDSDLEGEVWKLVGDGYSKYEASNKGRVRNVNTKRVLVCSRFSPFGYPLIGVLSDTGRRGDQALHVFVIRAFHGPKPFEGAETRHLDGNPLNNNPENLKWGTKLENMADMVEHRKSR